MLKLPMFRFLGFDLAPQHPKGLGAALLYGALGAFCDVVPYGVLAYALTTLANGTATATTALMVSAVLAAAFLAGWLCKAKGLLTSFSATYHTVASMRLGAADRLGRMPLGALRHRRGAALADLFTDRFSLYQDIATHMWWQFSSVVAFPVLLWLILAVFEWRLALVIVLFIPIGLAVVPWSFRLLDAATDVVIPARDACASRCVEVVEGIKDVHLLDPRKSRLQAAKAAIGRLRAASLATELAPAPAILAFGFVWALALAASITCAALLWTHQISEATTLVISLLLAARLCTGLQELAIFMVEYRFARRALQSIRDFVTLPQMPQSVRPQEPRHNGVDIAEVRFAHDSETTIDGITLTIPAGAMCALVGPSGSGKSTLAGLVARLWDVDSGAIRIGGIDIRDMDAPTLNATVSMVLQEVSLFELSIRDNIRLGRPKASQAEVEAAAKAAQIHKRILALPQGYDAILDKAGATLSGGERQRLAIARAILKDAPVLILDEASASIDLDCEWQIQEALNHLMRGRTVLVIAHRLWTVTRADCIAVMNGGRIAELGRHADLIADNGIYARLWEKQAEASGWSIS
ncbi:ATP-binding cassette, subfamily B [Hyphomicrobiales bacterium]|nr:ATP-binding cassette, subfamily B [Hyphomicrobiales bacterium]CAH1689500.1 ATP-binding cassette, subfamily B [Hyphomicrobiales bacterium]